MLEKLVPRLKKENVPLELSIARRHAGTAIDIDVLEACLRLGVKVGDPQPEFKVTFTGWLTTTVDHPFRNRDIVESARDTRYRTAIMQGLNEALACRGGPEQRGYGQRAREQKAFPLAAGDRPGIKELWRLHMSSTIAMLEQSGLASFEMAQTRLASTLWPVALRLFPDLAERLRNVDAVAMLERTLRAGVFDEYGLPALEATVEQNGLKIQSGHSYNASTHLTFPHILLSNTVHAFVIAGDGTVRKHELHFPKNCHLNAIVVVGDDLAVHYRDTTYQAHFYWVSNPSQQFDDASYAFAMHAATRTATLLRDGSVFLGHQAVRPGDKRMPPSHPYVHDGERFWRVSREFDPVSREFPWKMMEVDPPSGRLTRQSVPPWLEESDGGTVQLGGCDLRLAPPGAEDSPLGMKNGMLGWKTVKRNDGRYAGEGIDGRRWDKPLVREDGTWAVPAALLCQPGTEAFLPVTTADGRTGSYWLWDPDGSTVIAALHDFDTNDAAGQALVLPLDFWHFLRVRDLTSSRKLRGISHAECAALFKAAARDREIEKNLPHGAVRDERENPLSNLLPAVKALLLTAPERMVVGVARLIEKAERANLAFTALRDAASVESTRETESTAPIVKRKIDSAATQWGLPNFHIYVRDENVSISEHLAAAAAFLNGTSEGGNLPRTNYLWFPMLEDLPLRCWQTFWRARVARMTQEDNSEVAWLEFLRLWHDLGIAELTWTV